MREKERQTDRQRCEWGRGRERETLNLKQAPGSEVSVQSLMWGLNWEWWDHDLSWSRMPNQLSHPGAPVCSHFLAHPFCLSLVTTFFSNPAQTMLWLYRIVIQCHYWLPLQSMLFLHFLILEIYICYFFIYFFILHFSSSETLVIQWLARLLPFSVSLSFLFYVHYLFDFPFFLWESSTVDSAPWYTVKMSEVLVSGFPPV